ncbi:nuclear transport factor 2 family protein [uncultured Psychroserpens sp.]|uniref:nuclear transport factor 2 family protein n=1 Tax=uncultured Psychroserpens sp. TaxID=255436 RepID=UPI00263765FB|nr:nuclear transport factor 2 family protein [uncultured Psychroserpens sp.]
MKYSFILIALLTTSLVFSQSSETDKVKATIDRFFEGFHKQDSTMILETVGKDIKMQSIGQNREGSFVLNTSEFKTFLNSIVSIPKEKTFKEELLGYNIQIDGNMAHAWTPYNFWFDKNFSHCGVNSFQLFKDNGNWKIIYLIDTRRKDCRQE